MIMRKITMDILHHLLYLSHSSHSSHAVHPIHVTHWKITMWTIHLHHLEREREKEERESKTETQLSWPTVHFLILQIHSKYTELVYGSYFRKQKIRILSKGKLPHNGGDILFDILPLLLLPHTCYCLSQTCHVFREQFVQQFFQASLFLAASSKTWNEEEVCRSIISFYSSFLVGLAAQQELNSSSCH